MTDFTQAITLNPNFASTYRERGNTRIRLHNYRAAVADLTQAITRDPNFALAYRDRGVARTWLHEYKAALADFRKAADLYQQQGKTSDYQEMLKETTVRQKAKAELCRWRV